MNHHLSAGAGCTRRIFVAVLSSAFLLPACGSAEPAQKIKLAVFDIELDDFSTGGPIAGESAVETARLSRMTELARQLLAQSGIFEIVDVGSSENEMVKAHWLRKCNGCEAEAARALGADMAFIGFYRKISVMEQYLEIRIRDARSGELVHVSQTDLRGETDESWSRALKFLIEYRLVEPELAHRNLESPQK